MKLSKIHEIDVDKILVSNDNDNDVIRPLCIKLSGNKA